MGCILNTHPTRGLVGAQVGLRRPLSRSPDGANSTASDRALDGLVYLGAFHSSPGVRLAAIALMMEGRSWKRPT
eukprot:SAG31_NODE_14096_length_827_cov_1.965659_2_plen_73_part_01